MFTTGQQWYAAAALILFSAGFILYLVRRGRASLYTVTAGFVVYTLFLVGRGWLGGVFLFNPIVEGPYLLPWCIAVVVIIYGFGSDHAEWGWLMLPLVISATAPLWYAGGIIPPTPNKLTAWAYFFFLTEVGAHALFYCGAVFALHSLITASGDNGFHRMLVWGFLLYSSAQVIGAVWCYIGWGNTFRWGNRHMHSAAIWLLYAAYIHMRYVNFWTGRKRAVYAVAAALLTLFLAYGSYLHEMNFPRVGG